MSCADNFSWNALYNKMKAYMAESRPDSWIVATIQNSREMKTTYSGARDIIAMLTFLEGKAGEETAINNGVIDCEGGLFSSIVEMGG